MNVQGHPMRTIWPAKDCRTVEIIDQTRLPHELAIIGLQCVEDAAAAIRTMQVRGAPLIGATAAYGVALAMGEDPSNSGLDRAVSQLAATRPTAVNLRWALAEMRRVLAEVPEDRRFSAEVLSDTDINARAMVKEALGEPAIVCPQIIKDSLERELHHCLE